MLGRRTEAPIDAGSCSAAQRHGRPWTTWWHQREPEERDRGLCAEHTGSAASRGTRVALRSSATTTRHWPRRPAGDRTVRARDTKQKGARLPREAARGSGAPGNGCSQHRPLQRCGHRAPGCCRQTGGDRPRLPGEPPPTSRPRAPQGAWRPTRDLSSEVHVSGGSRDSFGPFH